ncbi:MAG: NAD+ synthetase [Planctomycetes bacterium]|nr:NAD+ synthetase [Planctomycetota bacterium]
MNRIRLGAAALNQTPMAWDTNCRQIRAALAAAREAGVGILCLPELCITGYGCEDMFFSPGIEQRAIELLQELLPDTAGIVACLGLPVLYEGALYNAVAVAGDGMLLGIVAKQHLAGDGIHYEPRWFRRWPGGEVGSIEIAGQDFPIGDVLFECGGVRIGFEICRDAWVADRTGCSLAQRGADVLLNPSASHFAFAKQQIRERFVLEGSRAFCVSYAYCNLLGNEAGRSIYDGGTLIATNGKMLVRGPRFSFADWLLTTTVVDVDSTRRAKAESFPVARSRDDEADRGLVTVDFDFPEVAEPIGSVAMRVGTHTLSVHTPPPRHPAWETGEHQKQEEFTRAVALALFDYLRKSHSKGFVVSISGGVDSSAVAVLIHLMVQLACRELGVRPFAEKLPRIPALLPDPHSDEAWSGFDKEQSQLAVRRLLTCVYQTTRNSSRATKHSAEIMSGAIGAEFVEWNVDALVDHYVETVSKVEGRHLRWETDDVALQNIQARARGPGAWLLANLRDSLLLTTSNRSEAAVGYATMDGDTCGGLAPIAGIDKAFLLDWLKWMETTGPAGIGPLPALKVVNDLAPTAELRPPAECQTDEADLMPYRVLDAIERAAIRDKLLPIDVFDTVRAQFGEYTAPQLGTWVERFFRLWCRNQWKRERYAPSFHLDDENLDPKTWCRFPILNSGFDRELAELREHVSEISAS